MFSIFVLEKEEKQKKEIMKKQLLYSHFSMSFTWKENCFYMIHFKVPICHLAIIFCYSANIPR